jgi:hypothetical protein
MRGERGSRRLSQPAGARLALVANFRSLAGEAVATCIRPAAVVRLSYGCADLFWSLAEHQSAGALGVLLVLVLSTRDLASAAADALPGMEYNAKAGDRLRAAERRRREQE